MKYVQILLRRKPARLNYSAWAPAAEPGRHIGTDPGHFAQVGTLAAEQHFILAVTLFERKDVLPRIIHTVSPGNTVIIWPDYQPAQGWRRLIPFLARGFF